MKKCNKCKLDKDLKLFYKVKNGKFGVSGQCKECQCKHKRNNYIINNEKIKDNKKEYYKLNRNTIINNKTLYYKNNKQSKLKYNINYKKQRSLIDPIYKSTLQIRNLITTAFRNKNTIKSKKTLNILGCTFKEFKEYIEKQFDDKMNWDNHGSYWHYDHIKPISLAKTEQEVYDLNHYTNFQPLERIENIKKGNKYIELNLKSAA